MPLAVTVRFCLLLFVLACVDLQIVSSTRFKIAISEEGRKSIQSYFDKRAADDINACRDHTKLSPTSALSMLPDQLQELRDVTTFARSEAVTSGMDDQFKKKVPGLDGNTVQDVIDALYEEDCLSLPYGGSVRDQFLGASPKDVDMETDCTVQEVYNICCRRWGDSTRSTSKRNNCGSNCRLDGDQTMSIGDNNANDGNTESIDAANWDNTFFGTGIYLEYTTNSIAYYAYGVDVIIDITGHGIDDTCNKKIRIPVGISDRDMWRENCVAPDPEENCVYRFWKLRINKGYTAIDSETMDYIVEQAKMLIMNDSGADFKQFYCQTILQGQFTKQNSSKCICNMIPASSCENKKTYDDILEQDLGRDTVTPLIESIEIACSEADTSSALSSTEFSLMGVVFTALLLAINI